VAEVTNVPQYMELKHAQRDGGHKVDVCVKLNLRIQGAQFEVEITKTLVETSQHGLETRLAKVEA
jgi:hypothetical protein